MCRIESGAGCAEMERVCVELKVRLGVQKLRECVEILSPVLNVAGLRCMYTIYSPGGFVGKIEAKQGEP